MKSLVQVLLSYVLVVVVFFFGNVDGNMIEVDATTTTTTTPTSSINSASAGRFLESNLYTAYFTNSTNGYNLYESYSLAWRYVGMYIDCDLNNNNNNGGSGGNNKNSNKNNNNNANYGTDGYDNNNGNGNQNTCSRKVR